jgi:hypothetical protein
VLIHQRLCEGYSLYRPSFRSFPKPVPLTHSQDLLPILRIPPL